MMLIPAACILIRNAEGKILSVSRKDDHTQWGLPGGKREPTETFSQCARRELKEETNLDGTNFEFVFCRTGPIYITATFTCDYTGEPSSMEGALTAWLTPQELANNIFGKYNRALFDFLNIPYAE